MRLTGEKNGLRDSVISIKSKQKLAKSTYNKLKKQASKERIQFGKRLIKARAIAKKTTVEAQERQLRNAFGHRKLAHTVKRLTGKQRGAPLRYVTAPSTNSTDRTEGDGEASIEGAVTEEGTR